MRPRDVISSRGAIVEIEPFAVRVRRSPSWPRLRFAVRSPVRAGVQGQALSGSGMRAAASAARGVRAPPPSDGNGPKPHHRVDAERPFRGLQRRAPWDHFADTTVHVGSHSGRRSRRPLRSRGESRGPRKPNSQTDTAGRRIPTQCWRGDAELGDGDVAVLAGGSVEHTDSQRPPVPARRAQHALRRAPTSANSPPRRGRHGQPARRHAAGDNG